MSLTQSLFENYHHENIKFHNRLLNCLRYNSLWNLSISKQYLLNEISYMLWYMFSLSIFILSVFMKCQLIWRHWAIHEYKYCQWNQNNIYSSYSSLLRTLGTINIIIDCKLIYMFTCTRVRARVSCLWEVVTKETVTNWNCQD